jgi:hypothetical protein
MNAGATVDGGSTGPPLPTRERWLSTAPGAPCLGPAEQRSDFRANRPGVHSMPWRRMGLPWKLAALTCHKVTVPNPSTCIRRDWRRGRTLFVRSPPPQRICGIAAGVPLRENDAVSSGRAFRMVSRFRTPAWAGTGSPIPMHLPMRCEPAAHYLGARGTRTPARNTCQTIASEGQRQGRPLGEYERTGHCLPITTISAAVEAAPPRPVARSDERCFGRTEDPGPPRLARCSGPRPPP